LGSWGIGELGSWRIRELGKRRDGGLVPVLDGRSKMFQYNVGMGFIPFFGGDAKMNIV